MELSVSSVSAPFCGDCHRARVSADGRLYTCLFAGQGHDLRHVLAQGEDALAVHVAGLWSKRVDRYSETRHPDAGSEAAASRGIDTGTRCWAVSNVLRSTTVFGRMPMNCSISICWERVFR